MTIQQHIEEALLKEQEERKDRERSGKYSPSSFGRCYRLQYWKRLNEPESNPSDISGLIRMKEGTLHHWNLQRFLPKEQVEIRIETDDILGFADFVTEDCVYDFKTTDSWKLKKFWDIPTKQIREKKKESLMQLGWYAMELNKPKVCLVGCLTGSLMEKSRIEHTFNVNDLKSDIENEVRNLLHFWKLKELPPAEPRAFAGKDCSYCGFRDKCVAKESHNSLKTPRKGSNLDLVGQNE